MGRNEKCACDACCGLRSLADRLKEEGKAFETAAATKALTEHKKRADFKQQHYRTERQNAKYSWAQNITLKSSKKPVISTPIMPKPQICQDIVQAKNDKASCDAPVGIPLQNLFSAKYADLMNEIKIHGLKCSKKTERMKVVLEKHYVNFHGRRPVRGIKRKSYELSTAQEESS